MEARVLPRSLDQGRLDERQTRSKTPSTRRIREDLLEWYAAAG
jgi:hypothetical protein